MDCKIHAIGKAIRPIFTDPVTKYIDIRITGNSMIHEWIMLLVALVLENVTLSIGDIKYT